MKKFMSLIMSLIMVLSLVSLTACTSDNSGETEKLSPDEVEEFAAKANDEYLTILKDNEKKIKEYTWQASASASSTFVQMQKPIAISDLNGDEVPELVFFMKDDDKNPVAHMYIYSYGKEGLTEMDYTFQDGKLEDNAVGAGDCYVTYLGDDGRVYIYKSHGDEKFVATVTSYVFNGLSTTPEYTIVKTDSIIIGEDGMFMGFDETFEKDGEVIDSSKGEKQFNSAVNSFKNVVIFSNYDGTDLYKKFTEADSGMLSFDDAVKQLGTK